MDVTEKIEQLQTDFDEKNGPFADVEFPEERFLSEISDRTGSLPMEDRLVLISAFATFDYNRDANQLVDNLMELHERNPSWFNARHVTYEGNEDILSNLFSDIGFRYPSRDAHAWYVNCEIITNKYHGKWSELLLSVSCSAPTLVERLEQDDFLCLKGVKIAPMYARIIDDEVCSLDNLWKLDIPVDTHIRRISKDLFSDMWDEDELTDDLIRDEWRGLAVEADIDRQVVDGGLWLIGNNWDEWGEDYWRKL